VGRRLDDRRRHECARSLQSAKATKLIESLSADEPGFVPVVALIELIWVLGSCYDLSRQQLAQALEALLRTKQLVLDQAEQVSKALRIFSARGADFADCLIERTAQSAGCERTMTFDVGASNGAGMTLIQ
jgi:predicted nucleic-acid-binding protein